MSSRGIFVSNSLQLSSSTDEIMGQSQCMHTYHCPGRPWKRFLVRWTRRWKKFYSSDCDSRSNELHITASTLVDIVGTMDAVSLGFSESYKWQSSIGVLVARWIDDNDDNQGLWQPIWKWLFSRVLSSLYRSTITVSTLCLAMAHHFCQYRRMVASFRPKWRAILQFDYSDSYTPIACSISMGQMLMLHAIMYARHCSKWVGRIKSEWKLFTRTVNFTFIRQSDSHLRCPGNLQLFIHWQPNFNYLHFKKFCSWYFRSYILKSTCLEIWYMNQLGSMIPIDWYLIRNKIQ